MSPSVRAPTLAHHPAIVPTALAARGPLVRVSAHVALLAPRGLPGRVPGRRGAAATPQPGADRGRRPRLRRARVLRPAEDRDAAPRRDGEGGAALHALLRGGAGLRAGALLDDDRAARRARLRARQRRVPRGGAARAPGRHGDAAAPAPAGRLRDGHGRQVGPRRPADERRAERAGLRPLVRLLLPAPGADVLPGSPVARREARGAARQPQGRHGRHAVLARPLPGGGRALPARAAREALLPLPPVHAAAPRAAARGGGPGALPRALR